MTDTDDALAARLRPTMAAYYDAPGPTDVERIVGAHPGGASEFLADCVEAARRWVTSTASAGEGASSPPSIAALPGP
jgi:hypothetical protein